MTISDNKGNQQSDKNAKLLLREIIGMDVPLEHLSYWLKGQPARITQITKSELTIFYLNLATHLMARCGQPIT